MCLFTPSQTSSFDKSTHFAVIAAMFLEILDVIYNIQCHSQHFNGYIKFAVIPLFDPVRTRTVEISLNAFSKVLRKISQSFFLKKIMYIYTFYSYVDLEFFKNKSIYKISKLWVPRVDLSYF